MKTISIPFILVSMLFFSCKKNNALDAYETEKYVIAASDKYNAFTDLTFLNNNYYCCYREGTSHDRSKGSIVVIESKNGISWKELCRISQDELDLRDPCFVKSNNGDIHINYFAKNIRDNSLANFNAVINLQSTTSTHQITTTKQNVESYYKRFLLWHVKRFQGNYYGVQYNNTNEPLLMISSDNTNYKIVTAIPNIFDRDNYINEVALECKSDGTMILVGRTLNTKYSIYGESKPPYTDWKFVKLPFITGGQKLLYVGNVLYLGTRSDNGVTLFQFSGDVNTLSYKSLLSTYQLGDTGYVGMIAVKNQMWMSYYCGNLGGGKSDIYLIKYNLPK